MKQRYLLTGGAGFLGINLCRFLVKKGHKVRILDIADFDYPDMQNIVEIIRGDIRDKKTVEYAVKGMDIVIHCAAALPLYEDEDIISTDVDGTKNMLEAAFGAGVKRFVHISSTAVFGIPGHSPVYEDDEFNIVGAYSRAKVLAEEACLEYRKKGYTVPIIRPQTFVGPERLGIMGIFYDWIYRGKNIPIIGSGKNHYQLLDVEDLCEAIYLCSTKPVATVNDTFNIGAKEFTTIGEDFQAVMNYAGHGKRVVPLPAAPVKIVLKMLEKLNLSPIYEWMYEIATTNSVVSIERAQTKLGFRPRFSNKDALIRNYKWYLDNRTGLLDKEGVSHRVPWKLGILRIFEIFF